MTLPLATKWADDFTVGIDADDPLPSEALPPIQSAGELLSHPPPKPAEIIEGLLHQGSKMVVGGASKSNKTWVLIDLAVSIATGALWWGFETKQGRVLYINFELGAPFFAERIKVVSGAKNVDPSPALDVWNLRGHAADFDRLLPTILARANQQYSLIVLDPTYKCLGQRDENRAGDIASLLNGFERLAVQTGAAVAFGAHFSKGNQAAKESVDRIGGSGVFARDPDTILTMTHHEQENAFVIEAILRNNPPISPFVVEWKYPLMQREDLLDPAKLKQARKGRPSKYGVQDLVRQLQNAKGRRGANRGRLETGDFQKLMYQETGMARSSFFDLLKEAQREGVLEKRRDKWQLVQKVQ